MPVDVSMYGGNTPAPIDPLATIGKVLSIQGAQQQLMNQQMEFKARQAMGPILQQSIDPNTGDLDINKFLIHGAANPDVAWKMPEITLQMIQRQNTQADTVMKNLGAAKIKYGAIGDAAGSLVAEAESAANANVNLASGGKGTPGITSKQMIQTLSGLAGEGDGMLLSSKEAAEVVAKTAGMTDAQRFNFVKNWATTANGINKTMDGIYGTITSVPFGGGTAQVQNNSLLRKSTNVGQVENVPTPAERNAATEVIAPGGSKVLKPRSEVAPMSGGFGSPAPGTPAAGTAPTVALSPMDQKLQEERAKAASEYEGELNTANTNGTEIKRVLGEMKSALTQFKSGGGMEVRQKLADMAQGIGAPQKLVDEIAGGNRGAIAEFQKLAVRYATQEMKTYMGSSQRYTNLDFSTFLKNNPTINTDPRGLDKMFTFLERGVDRVATQQQVLQHWKEGKRPKGYENSDISSFPAYWNESLRRVDSESPVSERPARAR